MHMGTDEKRTGREQRVCIIDDDDNIREIYATALELDGYQLLLAKNGAEGIELVRKYMPDIILLDLQMPVKNGMEVLEDLKGDEELNRIPVVILSNIDSEESFDAIGKYNTHFYLVKSLTTPRKVVGIVHEVLSYR